MWFRSNQAAAIERSNILIDCPQEFEPAVLNTFCVMQVQKLNMLLPRNFAVFESQFLIKYCTQKPNIYPAL